MEVLLYTILTLCALGVLSAVILYFVAQKFRVEEDPRIDEVEKMLPGANCGGCGFAGCRGMADALVKQDDISALFCPVGGGDCMKAVAAYLGKSAPEKEPQVATVRCGGTCDNTKPKYDYKGIPTCAGAKLFYGGDGACSSGCLGYGDCAKVCPSGAIYNNNAVACVDPAKCTGCGMCTKACPSFVIRLVPADAKTVVACSSKDKGAVAVKACKTSCIGCKKCENTCPAGAIKVEDNFAKIDYTKCVGCNACTEVCPRHAIKSVDFSKAQ